MIANLAGGAAAIAALAAAPGARAQIVQDRAAALAQDAAEYARAYGVTQGEAVRRLTIQHDSVAGIDAIAARYRDRLAGISVEHRPDYRFVVYLTGAGPVTATWVGRGATRAAVVFRTGAAATRDRLIWALTNHQSAIRAAFATPPSMGLDPRTGELVVIVGTAIAAADGGPAAIDAKLEALTGVPVQVRVTERTDANLADPVPATVAPAPAPAIVGGGTLIGTSAADGRRYRCTAGFAVTDGTTTAMTTAAHCLDTMNYYDVARRATPLGFAGQWGWGYHDVQVMTGAPVAGAIFHPDTARAEVRPVEAQRAKASTRAGDFLCHRGDTTGYSCGEVELLGFAPAGELCGGACLPTWVTVAGPGCKGGDSGGPVFSGTTAFGIVKGGSYRRDRSCAFYYYMSLDYLPAPWRLLIAPPVPPQGTQREAQPLAAR